MYPKYIREKDGISAHIYIMTVIQQLRMSKATKVATANVLAAWLDINPYAPPVAIHDIHHIHYFRS